MQIEEDNISCCIRPPIRIRFDGEDPLTFSEIDRRLKRINLANKRHKRLTRLVFRRKKPTSSTKGRKYRSAVKTSKIKWKEPKKSKKKDKPKSFEPRERLLPFYTDGPYDKPKIKQEIEEKPCQFYDHMNAPGCSYPIGNYDYIPCYLAPGEDVKPSREELDQVFHNMLRYGTADASIYDRYAIIGDDYYTDKDIKLEFEEEKEEPTSSRHLTKRKRLRALRIERKISENRTRPLSIVEEKKESIEWNKTLWNLPASSVERKESEDSPKVIEEKKSSKSSRLLVVPRRIAETKSIDNPSEEKTRRSQRIPVISRRLSESKSHGSADQPESSPERKPQKESSPPAVTSSFTERRSKRGFIPKISHIILEEKKATSVEVNKMVAKIKASIGKKPKKDLFSTSKIQKEPTVPKLILERQISESKDSAVPIFSSKFVEEEPVSLHRERKPRSIFSPTVEESKKQFKLLPDENENNFNEKYDLTGSGSIVARMKPKKLQIHWLKMSKLFTKGVPQMDFELPEEYLPEDYKNLKTSQEVVENKKENKPARRMKKKKEKRSASLFDDIYRPPIKIRIKWPMMPEATTSTIESPPIEPEVLLKDEDKLEENQQMKTSPIIKETEESTVSPVASPPKDNSPKNEEETPATVQSAYRTKSEELAAELHQTYSNVSPEYIQSFNEMMMAHLHHLKEIFLGNEAEAAAASLALPEDGDTSMEIVENNIPQEDYDIPQIGFEEREEELDATFSPRREEEEPIIEQIPSSTNSLDEPSSTSLIANNNMTDEDLETLAEFFPSFQQKAETQQLPIGENPSNSWNPDQQDSNRSRIRWYTDSEPTTSLCSRESSSETSGKTPEMAETPLLLQPFSAEDETFANFPYTATPTNDPNLLPSPIASQQ